MVPAENAKKRILLEDKLLKVSEKINRVAALGDKAEKDKQEAIKANVQYTEGYQKAVDQANKEVADGLEEQQKIAKQIVALQKESEKLESEI